MPPPKRPFTTSSLTSQLKSTIASQPLLSNLTNIEKLSSQASSLAQKAPFFNLGNHNNQQPQPQPQAAQQPAQNVNQLANKPVASPEPAAMLFHQQQVNQQQQQQQQQQQAATTPSVDMSHLTQEERLMIQSVMAKAEMADMGIPVDTSAPSSTNLPSHTSQILTQQRQQQQLQQLQHQQPQQLQQQHQQTSQYQPQPQPQPQMQHQQPQQQQQYQQQQPQQQRPQMIGAMNERQLLLYPSFESDQQQKEANKNTQLNQQTQQLVSQINSQFNLHQPTSDQQRQQQQPQQNATTGGFGVNQQQYPQTSQTMQQQQQPQLGLGDQASSDIGSRLAMSASQQQQQPMTSFDRQFNPTSQLDQSQSMQNSYLNLGIPSNQQQPRQLNSANTITTPSSYGNPTSTSLQQPQQSFASRTNDYDSMLAPTASNPMQPQPQQQFQPLLSSTGRQQQPVQQQQQQPQQLQQAFVGSQLVNQVQPHQTLAQQQQFLQQQQQQQEPMLVQPQQLYQPQQPITVLAAPQQAQQQYMLTTTTLGGDFDQTAALSDQDVYVTNTARSRGQRRQQQQVARQHSSGGGTRLPPATRRQDSARSGQQRALQAYDLAQSACAKQQQHQARAAGLSSSKVQQARKLPQPSQQQIDRSSQQMRQQSASRQLQQQQKLPATPQQVRRRRGECESPLEDYLEEEDYLDEEFEDESSLVLQTTAGDDSLGEDEADYYRPPEESPRSPTKRAAAGAAARQPATRRQPLTKRRSLAKKSSPSPSACSSSALQKNSSLEEQQTVADPEEVDPSADSPQAGGADKTKEEALKLLSELKLSKQASEVMEQQQLLIKQSQELIKLQLEQQQLSQELKKSMKSQLATEQENAALKDTELDQSLLDSKDAVGEKPSTPTRKDLNNSDDDADRSTRTNKSRSERHNLYGRKSTLLDAAAAASSSSTARERARRDSESELELDFDSTTDYKWRQRNNRQQSYKYQTSLDSGCRPSVHSRGASSRYQSETTNRQHSPTDTTDSDTIESSGRGGTRRNHQRPQSSSNLKAGGQQRRREPAGLPPSPLPVAAAIQMHQMQLLNQYRTHQQHLRSRSVTSSPNHRHQRPQQQLDSLLNSGYMTDGQQQQQRGRSVSPETLSEFGGQRRRKRLPEPPSNAIPITPSMVRKMIQAQRGSSSQAYPSSSSSIPPPPPASQSLGGQTQAARQASGFSSSTAAASSTPRWAQDQPTGGNNRPGFGLGTEFQLQQRPRPTSTLTEQHQHVSFVPPTTTTTTTPASELQQQSTGAIRFGTGAGTALGRVGDHSFATGSKPLFSSSTSAFGTVATSTTPAASNTSQLLKNNISEVKETPELDKMISDLNEYYGLDSSASKYRDPFAKDQLPTSSLSRVDPLAKPGPYLGSLGSAGPTSRFASHLSRCNSEGENGNMATRFSGRYGGVLSPPVTSSTRQLASGSYDDRPLYGTSSYLQEQRNKYSQRAPYPSSLGELRSNQPTTEHLSSRSAFSRPTDLAKPSDFPSSYAQRQSPTRRYQPIANEPLDSLLLDIRYSTRPAATSQVDQLHRSRSPWSSTSGYQQQQQQPSHLLDNPTSQTRHPIFQDSGLMSTSGRYSTRPAEGLSDPLSDQARQRRSYLTDYRHRSLDIGPTSRAYGQSLSIMRPAGTTTSGYLATDRPTAAAYNLHQSADQWNSINKTGEDHLGSYGAGDRLSSTNFGLRGDELSQQQRGGNFLNFTKDDIIRNGPKFDSIGYRFRTENQNKYVAQIKSPPIQTFQTRYPHPYKRILLSKNPKDRIGNGIGVRIVGGQATPSLYDKVNRCIVTSGAFVAEVFQNSNVYFMDEMHEGDQIVEWNGVNLCNRSDEEVQQILFSQFSDDEVEIVYLSRDKFNQAYGGAAGGFDRASGDNHLAGSTTASSYPVARDSHFQPPPDTFDSFSSINKAGDSLLAGGMKQENALFGTTTASKHYDSSKSSSSIRRKLSLSSIANMWK